MGNMCYCRFNNTLLDMEDCLEAIENQDIASEKEAAKAWRLFVKVFEFLKDYDMIEVEFDDDSDFYTIVLAEGDLNDMLHDAIRKDDD